MRKNPNTEKKHVPFIEEKGQLMHALSTWSLLRLKITLVCLYLCTFQTWFRLVNLKADTRTWWTSPGHISSLNQMEMWNKKYCALRFGHCDIIFMTLKHKKCKRNTIFKMQISIYVANICCTELLCYKKKNNENYNSIREL